MFSKVTVSRMLAVIMISATLMSSVSMYAGVKTEKAKAVLGTTTKVIALGFTTIHSVCLAALVGVDSKTFVLLVDKNNVQWGVFDQVQPSDVNNLKMIFAVCAGLFGAASYKLAKNLFKSYKNRNASTVAVNAAK